MAQKLNAILTKSPGMSVTRPGSSTIVVNQKGYTPKGGDEKKFVDIHKVEVHADRNGNGDEVFKGVVKPYDRAAHRMGYNPGQDQDAEFVADKSKVAKGVATESELGEAKKYRESPYSLRKTHGAKFANKHKKMGKLIQSGFLTKDGKPAKKDNVKKEEELISEATCTKACAMAQELSDKDRTPYFVHSFIHPDDKTTKRFGVVKKTHYDNDYDKHNYHLTHIIHPRPYVTNKKTGEVTLSTKKAVATSNESEELEERRRFIPHRRIAAQLRQVQNQKKTDAEQKPDMIKKESLDEKLDLKNPVGNWIHDFVHSKNPKFEGKSKDDRIRMALGGFYAAKNREGAK